MNKMTELTMAEETDRTEMQPALFKAAEAACIYNHTDGFCHPRNAQACRCWDHARAVMQATGLSAQAVAWVFKHTNQIEESAKDSLPTEGTNR